MIAPERGANRGRRETSLAIAVVTLFFLVRLALLVVREPFFDELFTVWMAKKGARDILPALLLDSGPPLYYFIARIPNVIALRFVSLAFATATLALILFRPSLGTGRWTAAVLLALYPPAALFAVDARAYALCGLFVALGAIAVHERRPFFAAGAFLAAAYTHWYGALFLPAILLAARIVEDRHSCLSPPSSSPIPQGTTRGTGRSACPPRRAFVIAFAAFVLFLPGLWLASQQPAAATGWLEEQHPFAAVGTFAFAGKYAEALFAPAPVGVIVVSAVTLLLAGARSWSFAPLVLVPVALAIVAGIAGRTVYFPMRFEAVIAAPLVLWLARSLQWWRRDVRYLLVTILCVCGGITLVRGARDHQQRPLDAYRQAAMVLAENVRPTDAVVASGYLYLEAVTQLGSERVRPYPSEQGRHPGWRVGGATREPLPPGGFVWIGERAAPELASFRGRRAAVVFASDRALILRVR